MTFSRRPLTAPLLTAPVQRVVLRPSTSAGAPVTASTGIPTASAPRANPVVVGRDRVKMAPEDIDVGRLTEHVIRAIDHRIIAERERLGRP